MMTPDCPDYVGDDRILLDGVYERQAPHQVVIVPCVHVDGVRVKRIDDGHECEAMMHKAPFLQYWRLLR